jgi:hypothetical protein
LICGKVLGQVDLLLEMVILWHRLQFSNAPSGGVSDK